MVAMNCFVLISTPHFTFVAIRSLLEGCRARGPSFIICSFSCTLSFWPTNLEGSMVPVVSSAEMLTDVNGIVWKLLAISAPLLASVSL